MKNIRDDIFKNLCLFLMIGLGLWAPSCQDPYADSTFTAFEELPMATMLRQDPQNFSLWVELMEHADLFNTYNLNTTYTFFVPNNDGVKRYLQNNGLQKVTDIAKDDAQYLIKYHTIHKVRFDQSQFESGTINDVNATDDNLSIEFREGGLNAIYVNGTARIVQLDVNATNGVVHVLEDVLVPVRETILDRLTEDRFSIFHEAVRLTGYSGNLNTVYFDATDASGNPIEVRYRFTLFAVSNEVFALEGIQNIDDLKSALGVESDDFNSMDNPLHKYVAYHILDQVRSYTDLARFPEGESTMNINTKASNELLNLSDIGGSLVVNYNREEEKGVNFTQSNVNCKNGVIHEMDNWMPLFTPPRVTVIWEFTDYPDLAAICTQFQNPSLGSTYTKVINQGELSSYTWRTVPEYKGNAISYRNNRGADGIWYRDALNHDHLRLELGPSGWIEMETPVLIKGSYRVVLVYISPRTSTNTGILQCSIDGRRLGSQFVNSNSREDRRLERQLSSSFSFDETTSHTFRIVAIDGRLLTLDYVMFEPVD